MVRLRENKEAYRRKLADRLQQNTKEVCAGMKQITGFKAKLQPAGSNLESANKMSLFFNKFSTTPSHISFTPSLRLFFPNSSPRSSIFSQPVIHTNSSLLISEPFTPPITAFFRGLTPLPSQLPKLAILKGITTLDPLQFAIYIYTLQRALCSPLSLYHVHRSFSVQVRSLPSSEIF